MVCPIEKRLTSADLQLEIVVQINPGSQAQEAEVYTCRINNYIGSTIVETFHSLNVPVVTYYKEVHANEHTVCLDNQSNTCLICEAMTDKFEVRKNPICLNLIIMLTQKRVPIIWMKIWSLDV